MRAVRARAFGGSGKGAPPWTGCRSRRTRTRLRHSWVTTAQVRFGLGAAGSGWITPIYALFCFISIALLILHILILDNYFLLGKCTR
jgi:hypothetical protein